MDEFYDKTQEQKEEIPLETPEKKASSKTMAYSVAALILSMMSLVCCPLGVISMLFGALAITCSILSRRHLGYFDSMALIGLIVGIVGTIFGTFVLIFNWLNPTQDFEQMAYSLRYTRF